MNDEVLINLLIESHTIAIVGLSPNETRPSHQVAKYLQAQGYRIIPVNPRCREILGERCYPALASIPQAVDLVDVFRRPDDLEQVARDAAAIRPKALWLQHGVVNEHAKAIAEAAGLTVVMDRCIKIEHSRLIAAS